MHFTESYTGLLAASIYIGNIIGSIICPFLFSKFQAKHITVISAVINALAVGVFSFTEDIWIIMASRIVTGLF